MCVPDTALSVVVVSSSSSCGLDLLGWASLFTAHTSKCSGGVAGSTKHVYISQNGIPISFFRNVCRKFFDSCWVCPSVLLYIYKRCMAELRRRRIASPASGPPFKESNRVHTKNEHILLWRPCANETDDGDDRH